MRVPPGHTEAGVVEIMERVADTLADSRAEKVAADAETREAA